MEAVLTALNFLKPGERLNYTVAEKKNRCRAGCVLEHIITSQYYIKISFACGSTVFIFELSFGDFWAPGGPERQVAARATKEGWMTDLPSVPTGLREILKQKGKRVIIEVFWSLGLNEGS
jgi:hypothetical protein